MGNSFNHGARHGQVKHSVWSGGPHAESCRYIGLIRRHGCMIDMRRLI
jgi:hypothetical protein